MSNRLPCPRRACLPTGLTLALLAVAAIATAQPRIIEPDSAAAKPSLTEITRSATDTLSSTPHPSEVLRPFESTPGLSSPSSQTSRLQPKPSLWQDLFAGTARDVTRLPSRQTFGLLAIGAAAAFGSHAADKSVSRSLSTYKTLDEPLEPGAVIGSTPFQLGASFTTYAIARLTNHPRLTEVSADLFRAQLLAQGLTIGLKQGFRRQRPEGSGYAFPSGHTTVSFASATVLQRHYGWKLGLPAYGVASYVALSRVQMRRHYLSDVAFGAALGIAMGRTVTLGHGPTFAISPAPTDGGAAVQFTMVGKK